MIAKLFGHLCIIGVIFFVIGKIDFSILHSGTVLHESTHEVLFFKMESDQEGYVWTNGMSRRSNKVHISSIGTRQKDQQLSCDKVRILATGSSSTFGSGLKDEEVWSSLLNRKFISEGVDAEVFNSANPGWGPYHWFNFVELNSVKFNPDVILIPLSFGDFTFYPVTIDDGERAAWVDRDAAKKKLLNFDNFISYSLRKTMYLLQSLKQKYQRTHVDEGLPLSEAVSRFEQHFDNQKNYLLSLVKLAENNRFKLVFFVRNADATKSGGALLSNLIELSNAYENVFVFQIHPQEFRPELQGDEIKTYYNENLIIKNDGHPNELYSALMAERLFAGLSPIVESIENPKNLCQ
ncbi:hypothetical protein NBRC116493_10620 [Aurantivibrio infirmus]